MRKWWLLVKSTAAIKSAGHGTYEGVHVWRRQARERRPACVIGEKSSGKMAYRNVARQGARGERPGRLLVARPERGRASRRASVKRNEPSKHYVGRGNERRA